MKKKLLALMVMGIMRPYSIMVLYNARSGLTRHEKDTFVCIARGRRPGHRGASAATSATHTDPTPAQLSL